ncbi:hypothetical protein HYDPIDRAFT_31473 [Hydnomerulius pinastri MD-312]|uniref:Uncharacterized protein n=1 Tax=Hydnomerulius pinastri MD-312 TaxID=994086 RepID=A0A0C9VTP3_9AGAM|nr:hypothetical protein HYDPIDRAFT_31473 [Hydnomerulius pinastri MD-312]
MQSALTEVLGICRGYPSSLKHVRGKKCLSSTLTKAKEIFQHKKAHINDGFQQAEDLGSSFVPPQVVNDMEDIYPHPNPHPDLVQEGDNPQPEPQDKTPLAQRRTQCLNCLLPKCYWDLLPKLPLPLPPTLTQSSDDSTIPSPSLPSALVLQEAHGLPSAGAILHQVLKMLPNKFGLFLEHTSEGASESADVSIPGLNHSDPFHPYPNENLLYLGEWYWNQGTTKSKESFWKLLNIISSSEFHLVDIQNTNWTAID